MSDPRSSAEWQRLAKRVVEEERICWLCAKPIDLTLRFPHRLSGSGDHVIPLDQGGKLLDRANVRAAHLGCNSRRGAIEGNRKRGPHKPDEPRFVTSQTW